MERWIAQAAGRRLYPANVAEVGYDVVTCAAVLALAPVIAVVFHESVLFVPVLLIPLARGLPDLADVAGRAVQGAARPAHRTAEPQAAAGPSRPRPPARSAPTTGSAPLSCCACWTWTGSRRSTTRSGHHVGDRAAGAASRSGSAASCASQDVVARLGGDEFAVYLPRHLVGPRGGRRLARRIRDALVEPFAPRGGACSSSRRASASRCTRSTASSRTQLLRRADVAMYLAKEPAHRVSRCTTPTHDLHSTDRLGLLAALRHALDDRRARPALPAQGVAGVRRGRRRRGARTVAATRSRGFIAARRVHPARRDLRTHAPAHRVRRRRRRSRRSRCGAPRASTSPSRSTCPRATCTARGWRRTVSEALARHRVPASLLRAGADRAHADDRARQGHGHPGRAGGPRRRAQPRRLRHRLLLDVHAQAAAGQRDQGGPVLRQACSPSAGEDASIVRSIVDLAHALGLQAVAEGVETAEAWQQLVDLGCDTAQGWYVSRPMPGEAASEWLRERVLARPRDARVH